MKELRIFIVTFLISFSLTAQVAGELYRPFFHYSPDRNWMSDPNGLVYYNGKYHLFYQYNPNGIQPANQSWGHAISTDLINWEELPVAIPVQNGIRAFSGSIVVDWNNSTGFGINGKPPLIAIYTGAGNRQDQRIAYSNDEGLTWTNYNQNPVLTATSSQFRDPKVFWHKETQKWIMVVTVSDNLLVSFYTSTNLKNWTLVDYFGPEENLSEFWECPDLFKLNVDNDPNKPKWVLIHSLPSQHVGQYFIGDFDGENFRWEQIAPPGILIDDFEHNGYNNWTVTGQAFGPGPAAGNLFTQQIVSGFLGNKLVNSFLGGSGTQGKLISPDFIIQKKFIGFLIGGGNQPATAYIKLVVNGATKKTSTGRKDDFLSWRNWDVSDLIGQTAHIEIIDSTSTDWGYISVDHIIQSDVIVDKVNGGQLDYGQDFYAPQTFSDIPAADGRRIWMAWMNNWNYATIIPTAPWKGIMTIPRELKLETHNGQVKLVQKPIEELKILRRKNLSFRNASLATINTSINDNTINNFADNSTFKHFELKAQVSVLNKTGFSLKFKKRGTEYSEYIFDFINKEIRFDRSKSGALTDWPGFRQLQVAPLIIRNGVFDLHLFVDNSSAELFSGGGQVVMSNQIFPDSTSNGIELSALAGDFSFDEFTIWHLGKDSVVSNVIPPVGGLFQVYPNPLVNSNGFNIKVRDESVGKVKFILFDITGKRISEFQPISNTINIPRDKLAASKGIYFLKGSDGNNTQTEKILVLEN